MGPREGVPLQSEADFGLTDNVPMDKRKRAKIVRTDLPTDILRRLVLADKLSLTVSAMSKALDDPESAARRAVHHHVGVDVGGFDDERIAVPISA